MLGSKYGELFRNLTLSHGLVPMGLYRAKGGANGALSYVHTAPPPDTPLMPGDKLFVLRPCTKRNASAPAASNSAASSQSSQSAVESESAAASAASSAQQQQERWLRQEEATGGLSRDAALRADAAVNNVRN